MRSIFLAGVLSLLIVLPFLLWGEAAETWVHQFLSNESSMWLLAAAIFLLLASDIVLPIPSSVVATASGAFLGIGLGTIVSSGGMTAGVIAGLLIGQRYGRPACRAFVGAGEYARLERYFRSHGILILVLMRPVPVLAEASVISAASLGIEIKAAITYTTLANLGVALAYACLGAWAADHGTFILVFLTSLLPPAIFFLGTRLAPGRLGH
ncbi:MAG: VTT domain-containing protein [Rhizomicrobium sp.]